MARPILDVRNVSKSFPDPWRQKHPTGALWSGLLGRRDPHSVDVLRDISFQVFRGQSVGLVGENGAGKSTLLKTICGVYAPTAGKIRHRGRIGAMLELGAGFHPDYTGIQNIEMSTALMGIGRRKLKALLPEIIDFSGLDGRLDEPIKHYSSGMVVRLGFAVLSVSEPDLLISDEVLAVGDASFQRKCIRWLDRYVDNGGTLLLVSHSTDQVERLCSQALWIKDGSAESWGSADEVCDRYLSYLDHKTADHPQASNSLYRVKSMEVTGDGSSQTGADPTLGDNGWLRIRALVHSPDSRPPVFAVGIKDRNQTAIFGTTSEIDGVQPHQVDENTFEFRVEFQCSELNSGRYFVTGHAMDPEALRLFDTVTCLFVVPGEATKDGFFRSLSQ